MAKAVLTGIPEGSNTWTTINQKTRIPKKNQRQGNTQSKFITTKKYPTKWKLLNHSETSLMQGKYWKA